ncbi:MAG: GNAT family N-acetyltransferase [Actinobacteria bacterium]|nr:MAG: GNAT family N-acetyltransferase [Actinomycetota bacterium]
MEGLVATATAASRGPPRSARLRARRGSRADGATILFKAEASAWTPQAVQLQQVWVDPEARGHRYAQRGLRDLCRLLLPRVPTICLFVRRDNAPAIRVYEAIGMQHTISYRSLIF